MSKNRVLSKPCACTNLGSAPVIAADIFKNFNVVLSDDEYHLIDWNTAIIPGKLHRQDLKKNTCDKKLYAELGEHSVVKPGEVAALLAKQISGEGSDLLEKGEVGNIFFVIGKIGVQVVEAFRVRDSLPELWAVSIISLSKYDDHFTSFKGSRVFSRAE